MKKSLTPISTNIFIGLATTLSLILNTASVRAEELPAECQSNYKPGAEFYNDQGVIKPVWELPGALAAEAWYFLLGDIKACD